MVHLSAIIISDARRRHALIAATFRDKPVAIDYSGRGDGPMTVIEIPDDQAAALRAKAAEQGLTLEAWLGQLARAGKPSSRRKRSRYDLSDLVAQCDPSAPLSAEDRTWLDLPPVGRESWRVERGDVYHVNLDPIQGREQAGARYVVVVSPKVFNLLGTPLVCPITQGGNFARHAGFAVSLSGAGTIAQGVILCNQPRVLDLQSRKARFVERVPEFIMSEVLDRLSTLIE
jgi:mRNA interferase ChpB